MFIKLYFQEYWDIIVLRLDLTFGKTIPDAMRCRNQFQFQRLSDKKVVKVDGWDLRYTIATFIKIFPTNSDLINEEGGIVVAQKSEDRNLCAADSDSVILSKLSKFRSMKGLTEKVNKASLREWRYFLIVTSRKMMTTRSYITTRVFLLVKQYQLIGTHLLYIFMHVQYCSNVHKGAWRTAVTEVKPF